MTATQLDLFASRAPAPHAGARPVYATPQPCGHCPAVATIYGRLAYDRGPAPIDLCAACTTAEVRRRRARGLHVPGGFEWVV